MNDALMQHYSEIIIEHSQFPHHHRSIGAPSREGRGENPFCGDRVRLQLQVDQGDTITDAAVETTGCAICIASGSLLASHLQGLSLSEAADLFTKVRGAILAGPQDPVSEDLGELAALSFASRYPSRVKCATLPWHVLKNVLDGDESVATTE